MSHSLAHEKRQEYQDRFGTPFDPARYSSPETTPADRRKLVASIKVCDALARQTDIHHEISRQPKALDVAILDAHHKHLPEEHEEQARVIRIWEPHAKSAS